MTYRTWDPFKELDSLRHQVERAFEEFTGGRRPLSRVAFLPGLSARAYPLMNVSEDADNVYVEALAPGVDPESLEISVLQDTLRVAGDKPPIRDDIRPEQFHRNERSAGRFVRSVTLPTAVNSDSVSAEYKNGVLLITLPKTDEAKPKQISVSVH
ncbi:MAG: Hsp20/alpha crystallin family protein [bacterium]|nr:Hsp20/alpha crystallin family protein [bacterium]